MKVLGKGEYKLDKGFEIQFTGDTFEEANKEVEDLISVLIHRMNHIQGLKRTREGSLVTTKLEEAVMWSRSRQQEPKENSNNQSSYYFKP